MPPLKTVFGAVGALVAVIYCGSLLYYFLHNAGSLHEAQEIGLGPTVLGLGLVGGLFCVAFLVRLALIFAAASSAASPARKSRDTSKHDDDGDFDADAVIARHMARRSADASDSSDARPVRDSGGPARPTFGRKGT